MRRLALLGALASIVLLCGATQIGLPWPGPGAASSSFPAITLGIHGVHNNGASASTTTVISGTDWAGSNATPTAGSTIVCFGRSTNAGNWDTVSDNVNSGLYQVLLGRMRDAGHNFDFTAWYKENVAASPTTVTMTAASGTSQILACEEWQHVPASYVLDSAFLYSRAATSTNPAYSGSQTPSGDNEVVVDGMGGPTSGVTAGSGFTLVDTAGSNWPQYQIQTTATATTGAYVDGSSSSYAIGMAALAKNHSGTCDTTMIIDWSGAGTTPGTIPTTTNLQASTHGGQSQPGAEYTPVIGWTIVGLGTGVTYNTSAYVPLATSRTCPYYTGSATGTNGIQFDVSAGANHTIQYSFANMMTKTSLWTCVSTDIPPATNISKGQDIMQVHGADFSLIGEGNGDYIVFQLNVDGGGVGRWQIEALGGNSAASTSSWVVNTNYGIQLTYNQAGIHTAKIYNGCGANPTLIETMSASGSVAGGAPADLVSFGAIANSFTTGHINFGAAAIDDYYGGGLLP